MKVIEYQLTEKQYINGNMVLLFRKPTIWLAPILLFLLILPKITSSDPDTKFTQVDFFIVFLIIYFILSPAIIYFRAKKFYAIPSTGAIQRVQIEFHEDAFVSQTENCYSRIGWNRISKVVSTKNWLFIWENPFLPTLIPKSAIWEGELLRLREILEANKIKHNFQ